MATTEMRRPLIRLRPDPPTEDEQRAAYEARRATPLGGKAHEHQRKQLTPPTGRKARTMPRSMAAGGSVWWRSRMEALRLKRVGKRKDVVAPTMKVEDKAA